MFDLSALGPEAKALLKVLSPKPSFDRYKITLNIEHNFAGHDVEEVINIPLDGVYSSIFNVTLVSGLFREMSVEDIQWCLKDYPHQMVGKVRSFTPVIVKM